MSVLFQKNYVILYVRTEWSRYIKLGSRFVVVQKHLALVPGGTYNQSLAYKIDLAIIF